ncbi:hypothetical protein [Xenorhabdus eapokensis]|uniref:Uncharacterized protein n=1 Tax=Xenorhabdus eapokensis TaxID=1873482 RepID=A0A1Q5TQV8_9GAMM|nr:hypothetical protein [Xenorhabdus eapokensis]OKP02618.1 hypothetical protein Xedl_02269 [Xenorhabdus eapokensis]
MRLIQLVPIALCIMIPFSAHSKSIDDFFDKNTALRNDVFTKEAVYDQAMVFALADINRTEPTALPTNTLLKKFMDKNGYNYALLGMRVLKSVCKDNDVMEINNLTERECKIIFSYKEK